MLDTSFTRPLRQGMVLIALGLGGFALWSTSVRIDGAVVAAGQISTDAPAQTVQHRDGGRIAAVHVREGESVRQGDPILTLEDGDLRARLTVLDWKIAEATARRDRLRAETLGRNDLVFDSAVSGLSDPEIATLLAEETALFDARRITIEQQTAQLAERARQSQAAISGLVSQREALLRKRGLVRADLDRQETLLHKGLAVVQQVSDFDQTLAGLDGQLGEIDAAIAETRSAISGFELERLVRVATFREAAQNELTTLLTEIARLGEERRLIAGQMDRLIMRAPMTGKVHELRSQTIAGVIAAGATVATIVPANTAIVATVRIAPSQIDRVTPGQSARIRFSSMGTLATPEISGVVRMVSADVRPDPVTGHTFYAAEILLAEDAGFHPQPGQPITAFLHTDARTPASFLLKPAGDYWAYAMRER